MHTVRLSFLARDRAALATHVQTTLGVSRPVHLLDSGARIPAGDDWLEPCLAPNVRPVSAAWGPDVYDGPVLQFHPTGVLELILPLDTIDATGVLATARGAPFDVGVVHAVYDDWHKTRFGPGAYRATSLSEDLGPMGWACLFRGPGLDRIPARFLEHGPWRTSWLDASTAITEFHDLGDPAPEALKRAAVGHFVMRMGGAYMDLDGHQYRHDLAGIYVPDDQTHRIVVVDREVSPNELLDACVYRARNRDHPERPVRNVAYVFPKHEQAAPVLKQLWLRGLECRVIDDQGVERRLDEEAPPVIERPAWVSLPPSRPLNA